VASAPPNAVRFHPHVWGAALFWAEALFFGGLCYAALVIDPSVDVSCRRAHAGPTCEIVTQDWPRPSVVRLADGELAAASLAVLPEPHDHSYKKVELQGAGAPRLLADFTEGVGVRAVDDVNDFLADTAPGEISRRIVATDRGPLPRVGLFAIQALALLTLLGGFWSLLRRTTVTVGEGQLQVRHSRWPLAARRRDLALADVASIVVVSRIPGGLAQVVASLPWRNIYRANALAAKLTGGDEVPISELCKRGVSFHERLAASIREGIRAS